MTVRKKKAGVSKPPVRGTRLNRTQKGKQIATLRKKQITNAAYEVIAKKGYYNFTMLDIAGKAGVSSGLIHHYFKDKENMLVTLLREMQQDVRTSLEKTIVDVPDPAKKLDIFMDQAFDLVISRKEYIYVTYDFMTQIKFNERMQRILSKLYRGYRETLESILKEGKQKKKFKNVDEHYLATVFISILLGFEQQYILDSAAFPYKEYTQHIKDYMFSQVLTKK